MENEKVFEIIRASYIAQARLDSRLAPDAKLSPDTILLGRGGLLDSMSVVAFLLELEDQFKTNLLDEVMAAAQKRPGFTLRDLSLIICQKLGTKA